MGEPINVNISHGQNSLLCHRKGGNPDSEELCATEEQQKDGIISEASHCPQKLRLTTSSLSLSVLVQNNSSV